MQISSHTYPTQISIFPKMQSGSLRIKLTNPKSAPLPGGSKLRFVGEVDKFLVNFSERVMKSLKKIQPLKGPQVLNPHGANREEIAIKKVYFLTH